MKARKRAGMDASPERCYAVAHNRFTKWVFVPRLVAEAIASELRRRIEGGQWLLSQDGNGTVPGRLPAERDLAKEFGVARNTVRRAMGVLERDGVLKRQVGRGTFVQPQKADGFAASLSAIAGASPADMMEVRRLIEPAAAGFAATNASAAELHAVAEAHREAKEAGQMPEFEHWDAEFHHRIFACSRNAFLKELHHLMRLVRNQEPWFEMKKRSFSEARRQIYCVEHEAVLDALFRRNPDAARRAMEAHLLTVERNLLGR